MSEYARDTLVRDTANEGKCPNGFYPRFGAVARRKDDCRFFCVHTKDCKEQAAKINKEKK